MRKTNKYYRDNLRNSISSASSVVKEVLEKYFKGEYRTYAEAPSSNEFWNCRIEGIGVSDNGIVYVLIYWQGDSTDGYDTIYLNVLLDGDYVIVENDKHGRLYVKREWLQSSFKKLADLIEPKKIKEREIAEKRRKAVLKINKELCDYFYNNYGGGYGRNDKYYNGIASVRAFVEENWESLSLLDAKERLAKAKIVFDNNYKYDLAFDKDEKGHFIYNLSI